MVQMPPLSNAFPTCLLSYPLGSQVSLVGEAFIEVGMPNGWGATGLDKPQLALVLAKLQAASEASGCDLVVMRQRVVAAQALTDTCASLQSTTMYYTAFQFPSVM